MVVIDSLLKTQSLTKRFRGVVAVNHVDFSIQKGEIKCLIGPNGAGKSTLVHLICGTIKADSGSIWFKDHDITDLLAFQRIRMGLGLKFQTNRAFRNLTVDQNLRMPLRKSLGGKEEGHLFFLALRAFKLEGKGHQLAKELPHNELQWLEICMALACEPDILFLDEPTAGMSPEETYHTANVIKRLNAEGLAIVVVEHDMGFVRELGGRVTVFHQGNIFVEGTMEEVSALQSVKEIYLGRA